MKKIIYGLVVLFVATSVQAKKPISKTKVNVKTKKSVLNKVQPAPEAGRWVYGILKEYPMQIFQCVLGPGKCLYIPKNMWDGVVEMKTIKINTSIDPNVENILEYQISELIFETNAAGEEVFRTVPPIQIP